MNTNHIKYDKDDSEDSSRKLVFQHGNYKLYQDEINYGIDITSDPKTPDKNKCF